MTLKLTETKATANVVADVACFEDVYAFFQAVSVVELAKPIIAMELGKKLVHCVEGTDKSELGLLSNGVCLCVEDSDESIAALMAFEVNCNLLHS